MMSKLVTVAWLRTFKWDWFVTLVPYEPQEQTVMQRVMQEWLNAWRDGHRKFYSAYVIEYGNDAGWHTHCLIGGLGTHPEYVTTFAASWRGHIDCKRYAASKDANRNGVMPYMLKSDEEVTLFGSPKRYRPRVRKCRVLQASKHS